MLFLDTAGLDDTSLLAEARLKKTGKVFGRADVILLVTEADVWTDYEESVLTSAAENKIPVIIIVNKIDVHEPSAAWLDGIRKKNQYIMTVSCLDDQRRDIHVDALKRLLIEVSPDEFVRTPSLVGDLVPAGGIAVLVTPIDLQAPKGRLILPQVQTIRDALDCDAAAVVVKERELPAMLAYLNRPPDVVICDSQAILKVSADVPKEIPCTTFSILFNRQKGDLVSAAEGVTRIDALKPGDKVLIAEACSHHALEDDIGRVKIPRWLRQYVGAELDVSVYAGRDFPDNLGDYRLIIHCGACMLTRREMLYRIQRAKEANVPMTNYGVAISFLQGVARRVLSPFPSALMMYDRRMKELKQNKT